MKSPGPTTNAASGDRSPRPARRGTVTWPSLSQSPAFLTIKVFAIVFVGEVLVMALLAHWQVSSPWQEALLDATLLSVLIGPLLYVALFRPLVRHIGERARAEQALADAESRFRTLFEQSPVGVVTLDLRSRQAVEFNDLAARQLGYPREEFARLRMDDYEALDTPEQISARVERLQRDGAVLFETRHRTRAGEIRDVLVTGRVTKLNGHVLANCVFQDVTERKQAERELKQAHKELLEVSRQAGKAEVATGVLHNVGNVLNSLNVSVALVTDQLRNSRMPNLKRVAVLLREQGGGLEDYLTKDPKGRALPEYLVSLAEHLTTEHERLRREMAAMANGVEHVKEIVAMQQNYAQVSGLIEPLVVAELVDDAVRIHAAALARHHIQVVREFAPVSPVMGDRHKVLQILVNLVSNAKQALKGVAADGRELRLGVHYGGPRHVSVSVRDNGTGIAPENLTRIFQHGFTTRKDGHGFGLHSGANAAKEMGGRLTVHSEGSGKGATFILELPVTHDPQ